MTEISAGTAGLPPAIQAFILQWGDMGGQWGVNRSVAQIQALLYMSERPLTADDIADALGMARSNVSNSVKDLLAWGLIRRVPVLGDRREHFEADTDVWSIATKIVAQRKEREIDPALAALTKCVADANGDPRVSKIAKQRLEAMREFTETAAHFYEQMAGVARPKMMMVLKLGAKVVNLLPTRKVK